MDDLRFSVDDVLHDADEVGQTTLASGVHLSDGVAAAVGVDDALGQRQNLFEHEHLVADLKRPKRLKENQ